MVSRKSVRFKHFRPSLEILEGRTLPSTVYFTNSAGGDWDTPGNWSTGAIPGATDDVVIALAGIVVTHTQNTTEHINSLSLSTELSLNAGAIAMAGGYTQSSTGILDACLAGANQFSQVTAGGTATLNGTLNVVLTGGYVPTPGSSFPLFRFGSETGNFAAENGLQQAGVEMYPQESATGLSLNVPPAMGSTAASVAATTHSSYYGQQVTFTASVTSNSFMPGLAASYYNLSVGPSGVATAFNVPSDTPTSVATLVTRRTESQVNVPDSGGGFLPTNPVTGLNPDNSAASWSGFLQITQSGSYTFFSPSDDGSLLYVDGTQVVNNDGQHGYEDGTSTSITLSAGLHTFLELFEQGGYGAGVEVDYQGPATQGNREIIPAGLFFHTFAGTVTFYDGTTILDSAAIDAFNSATVSFTTSLLSVGSHSITAAFTSGDNAYSSSPSSPAANDVVSQAATTTAVTSSANPSGAGQDLTLTATVSSPGFGSGLTGGVSGPTGTVQFDIDGQAYGSQVSLSPALSFDGNNQYAISPNLANAFPGSSVTVELWFQPEAAGVILDELGQAGINQGWHDSQIEILPSGDVQARVWDLPSVDLGYASFGAWHHVAIRYNSATGALDGFLDGVQSSVAYGSRQTPWSYGLGLYYALGGSDTTNLGSGAWFNGMIDNVSVWNVALPASQVNNSVPPSPTAAGLVADWPLNDGSGLTGSDLTGNYPLSLGGGNPINASTWVMTASISDAHLTTATHTITASYSGDGNYLPSNNTAAPLSQVIVPITSSVPAVLSTSLPTVVSTAGTALAFNGYDSYAITPDLQSSFTGTSETIELWFNANGPGVLLSELGSSSWFNVAYGYSGLYKEVEILSSGEVVADMPGLPQIDLGQASFGVWHFLVLRYNSATETLDGFLDGVQGSSSIGARYAEWQSGLGLYYALGSSSASDVASGIPFFNGTLDDISIWNAALPTLTVLNFSQPPTATAPNLVADWQLNDGSGTTASDANGQYPLSFGVDYATPVGLRGITLYYPTWVTSNAPIDGVVSTGTAATQAAIDSFSVVFTRPLTAASATSPASYSLVGSAGDPVYALTPSYVAGSTTVTFTISPSPLQPGTYTFQTLSGLTDTDGDSVTPFTLNFTVSNPSGGQIAYATHSTMAGATPLPFTEESAGSGIFNSLGVGAFSSLSDSNYWSMSVGVGDTLSVKVQAPGLYPTLEVLDANGNLLTSVGGNQDNNPQLLYFKMPATGTYYLALVNPENTGPYQMQVSLTQFIPGAGFFGQYYSNINLSGPSVFTRQDDRIRFNWGAAAGFYPSVSGSTAYTLNATNFSVRWTGQVFPHYSEVYTFTTESAGGVRVYLNGNLIINDWTAHADTFDSNSLSLTAGQSYDIEVDYYATTGAAIINLSWSSPSTPQQIIDPAVSMGINADGISDSDGIPLFVNLMDQSRKFGSPAVPYDQSSPVDANGWPTQDFGTVLIDPVPLGTYTLSFTGLAQAVTPVISDFTVGPLVYDALTNTTTTTLTQGPWYGSAEAPQMMIAFTGTQRTPASAIDTGLTNIQVFMPEVPGSPTSFSPSVVLNPAAENLFDGFTTIRFMGYSATNGTNEQQWSDRTLPGAAQYTTNSFGAGGPWEYAVMLANETGKDMWINIPANADDNYITNLADLIRYGSDGVNPYTSPQANPVFPPLQPNLNVYIEYSNEVWNGSFPQYTQNLNDAIAEVNAGNSPLNYDGSTNQTTWEQRRLGERTVQISNIFRSVFGDGQMMSRIRPVLEYQEGFPYSQGVEALEFINDYYNNAVGQDNVAVPHPVNYFIWGAGSATYFGVNNQSGLGDITVNNDSFETPSVTNYQADPTGAGWTFSGTAGIAANGSSLGNANAPDGTQAAYIQGTGSFSETVDFTGSQSAIAYQLAFAPSSTETFQIYYDGIPLDLDLPSYDSVPESTSYIAYDTLSFPTTPGPHTIEFVGQGGNGTVFLDLIQGEDVTAIYNSGLADSYAADALSAAWAHAFGLHVTGYEGGFSIGGIPSTDVDLQADLDPLAEQFEAEGTALDFEAGSDLVMNFAAADYSPWGLADPTIYTQDTPKLQALDAFMRQPAPAATDGTPLPTAVGQSATITQNAAFFNPSPDVAFTYTIAGMAVPEVYLLDAPVPGIYTVTIHGMQYDLDGAEHFMLDGERVPGETSLPYYLNGVGNSTPISFAITTPGLHALSIFIDGPNVVYIDGGNITITLLSAGVPSSVPAGWSDGDVGSPALAGQAVSYDASNWVVAGSGSGIGGSADQFHFASSNWSGNGTVSAQVLNIVNTASGAQAGVMFRDGTAAGALFASVLVTPADGISFQWRPTIGGSADEVNVAGITSPVWLKLVRSGDVFRAYYSTDGYGWSAVGTPQVIQMASTVDAGLAVSADNDSAITSANFIDVSISSDTSTAIQLTAFNFAGDSGPETTQNPDVTALNVTASAITRGSGLAAADSYAPYIANSMSSLPSAAAGYSYASDLAGAITDNEYYQFTVAPSANYLLTLSSISFAAWTWPGYTNFGGGLEYSTDGVNFTTVPLAGSFNGAEPQGPIIASADLSGITALEDIGATVTFRIFLFGEGLYISGIGETSSDADVTVSGHDIGPAPTVGLSGPTTGVPGQQQSFTFTANESSAPNQTSGYLYQVNWGDGSPVEPLTGGDSVSATHVFTTTGTPQVSVTATYLDGAVSAPATQKIAISTAAMEGNSLYVVGTTGNDVFVFTPGSGGSVGVILNGASLGSFDPTASVVILGDGGTDSVMVNGTAGNDAFTLDPNDVILNGLPFDGQGIASWTVNGQAGNDTFTVDAGATTTIVGGSGSDTVVGPTSSNSWVLSGSGAGTLDGTVSFSKIKNLVGGAGNDSFQFQPNGSLAGTINGEGGTNTLDYSVIGRAVSYTPSTGVASAVDAGAAGGAVNIQALVGNPSGTTLFGPNQASIWTLTGNNAGTLNNSFSFSGVTELWGSGADTLIGPNSTNSWKLTNYSLGTLNGTLTYNKMANLTGGSGNDTFQVGPNGKLSGKIDGGAGTNTLDYSIWGRAFAFTPGAGTAPETGSIANIEALVGSAAGTTILGPNTTNTWTLTGSEAGNLNGTFTFSNVNYLWGGTGIDTVVGPASTDSWVMSNYDLGTLNGVLTFNKMENLVGGSGNNSFQFQPSGKLTGTITGGGGTNTLDYSLAKHNVSVTPSAGTATDTAGISNIQAFIGSAGVSTLFGPNAANTWTLTATGTGNLNNAFSFSGFNYLYGGTGTDTLIGPSGNNTWVLTGLGEGTLNGTLSFNKMENLTGGVGNDDFALAPAGEVTGQINGAGGTNTLDYSSYGLPASVVPSTGHATKVLGGAVNIESLVGSKGGTTLDAANVTNVWSITGSSTGTLNGTYSFSGVQNLTGGAKNDTFQFGPNGKIAGIINGGTGTNTLDYSLYGGAVSVTPSTGTASLTGGIQNIQNLVGTASGTTLFGPNQTNTWTLTGTNTGNLNGTFTFTGVTTLWGGTGTDTLIGPNSTNAWVVNTFAGGTLNASLAFDKMENLTGGSANDTFAFKSGGKVTGTINGGGGSNTLDYTSLGSRAVVNLTAGTATETGGVSNILVVLGYTGGNNILTGGPGGSILVGFGSGNVLTGGAGVGNLLIGGTGADTLNSGNSGDLMIGGSTAYDTNTTALLAIFAEWQNTSQSYAQRISDIMGTTTGGLNGSYDLNSNTVTHATSADTLVGGTGSALDWFFAIQGRDTIKNLQTGEQIS